MSRTGAKRKLTAKKLLQQLEKNPRKAAKLSKKQFTLLQKQFTEENKQAKAKKTGQAFKAKFKPTKKQRGKLLLISKEGKPVRTARQKGILVFVTKSGKVQQVQQPGKKGFSAVKAKDVEIPHRANLKAAAKQFRKRVLVGKGKAKQPQLRGKVQKGALTPEVAPGEKQDINGRLKGSWGSDFNEKAIKKVAASIRAAIKGQKSRRTFIIAVYAIVETEDGEEHTLYFEVDINTADWRSINKGGLDNFVRMKFYATMAKELAIHGYVSSGSDNHIRRLKENEGAETDELTNDGIEWSGIGKEVVLIKQLEWQIQQA
jgi:hypothetical protein